VTVLFCHLCLRGYFFAKVLLSSPNVKSLRKSSSNKLSVFSALNLPYWAASTLIKAKNIPSDKLKNSKTEGKKIRAYGTD